jgi:hypothetical protein
LLAVGAFIVGSLVAIPFALWTNFATYGSPFGLPRLHVNSAWHGFAQRILELHRLFVPALSALWLFALVAVLLRLAVRSDAGIRRQDVPLERNVVLAIVGSWIPFYLVALVASTFGIVTDSYDARLLSPVAPAIVVLVVAFAARGATYERASRAVAMLAVAIAAGAYTRYSLQRIAHAPRPVIAADLATWAHERAGDDALFIGSYGWNLRDATGVITLVDGYPEMSRLDPEAVRRFVETTGRRFRRVYFVFQPEGSMPPRDVDRYVESFVRAGWTRTESQVFGATRTIGMAVAGIPGTTTPGPRRYSNR